MHTNRTDWTDHAWTVLVVLYLLFIAAASFYLTSPTAGGSTALESLFSATRESLRPSLHNVGDVATNFVLYLPLGVLVCFARNSNILRRFLTGWLLAGFAVSLCVEICQAFVGRYSDFVDVLSNGLGYLIGYGIAWLSIRRFGLQPGLLLGLAQGNAGSRLQTLAGLRFAYVILAFVTGLLPFDLTISPGEIVRQLHSEPPRLILNPFYHFGGEAAQHHWLVLKLLVVLPFALLCGLIRRDQPSMPIRVARDSLLFLGVLEVSKAFVKSASSDVLVILAAPLSGFLIGLWLARHQRPGLNQWATRSNFTSSSFFYLLFVVLIAWSPYRFEPSFADVLDKIREINWVPFRLHFSTRTMASAFDLVKESGLYIPLGLLLSQTLASYGFNRTRQLMAAIVAAFTVGAALESSQLIVAERYPDITDPLLAALGCAMGVLLRPLVFSRLREE